MFTARLVALPEGEERRVLLDKIKLRAGKDVPLGDQFVLATNSRSLGNMLVVLGESSLRSAFGMAEEAVYGIDPSAELFFDPSRKGAYKLGSSVDNGKSYCCSVVRGLVPPWTDRCVRKCAVRADFNHQVQTFQSTRKKGVI